MYIRHYVRAAPLWVLALVIPTLLNGSLVTIVNSDVTIDGIERGDLRRVFQGKLKRWPNGERVVPVIYQNPGALSSYTSNYFSQSSSEFTTYWKRLVFTGRGSPPKAIANADDLVEFVSRTDGAIGFVPEEAVNESIKVIQVF